MTRCIGGGAARRVTSYDWVGSERFGFHAPYSSMGFEESSVLHRRRFKSDKKSHVEEIHLLYIPQSLCLISHLRADILKAAINISGIQQDLTHKQSEPRSILTSRMALLKLNLLQDLFTILS